MTTNLHAKKKIKWVRDIQYWMCMRWAFNFFSLLIHSLPIEPLWSILAAQTDINTIKIHFCALAHCHHSSCYYLFFCLVRFFPPLPSPRCCLIRACICVCVSRRMSARAHTLFIMIKYTALWLPVLFRLERRKQLGRWNFIFFCIFEGGKHPCADDKIIFTHLELCFFHSHLILLLLLFYHLLWMFAAVFFIFIFIICNVEHYQCAFLVCKHSRKHRCNRVHQTGSTKDCFASMK